MMRAFLFSSVSTALREVFASGMKIMSDSSIDLNPRTDDPLKADALREGCAA
jgi:hypothetical protein